MKKLIVISILFIIISVLSVLEIGYDSSHYLSLSERLTEFAAVLNENEENIAIEKVSDEYNVIAKQWEDMIPLVSATTNHNIIRTVSEKFAYLQGYIEANAFADAYVTVEALRSTVEWMKEEKYPLVGNLF